MMQGERTRWACLQVPVAGRGQRKRGLNLGCENGFVVGRSCHGSNAVGMGCMYVCMLWAAVIVQYEDVVLGLYVCKVDKQLLCPAARKQRCPRASWACMCWVPDPVATQRSLFALTPALAFWASINLSVLFDCLAAAVPVLAVLPCCCWV
jgi:hypothetical protein